MIFGQIAGFQSWLVASCALSVTITAGVWAVVISDAVRPLADVVLALFHLAACLWLAGITLRLS